MQSLNDFLNVRLVIFTSGLVAYLLWVLVLVHCLAAQSHDMPTSSLTTFNSLYAMPRPLAIYAWSIGQWCYWISPRLSELLTSAAWQSLEQRQEQKNRKARAETAIRENILDIPTIKIQDFVGDETGALEFLQLTYGRGWQERPLHLKGLWDPLVLQSSQTTRQLSPYGLLHMNFTIPYYLDARIYGLLRPDGVAPVNGIVQRMLQGHPHKIGSQLIVQRHPEFLSEVAPLSLVTTLFGDYFSVDRLLGQGKTFGVFPGITTVPVFVAYGNTTTSTQHQHQETHKGPSTASNSNGDKIQNDEGTCQEDGVQTPQNLPSPSTGLHCEPIANVAVQLHGFRKWTLVDPQHSWVLRPAASKDGRSFYPSWATTLENVPRYELITYPGDAVFVPTWTWHRVDYLKESADLSIGASLFHFRVWDYIRRNPLFAILLVPALVGELAGTSSQ
jgi:hypothetical protein